MSDLQSALYLKAGAHSSTTDFSGTPTLVDLLPEKFDGFGSPDTIKLARNPAHPLNKRFASNRGPLDLSKPIPLEFIVRGLNGNTGAAIVSSTTNDLYGAGIWQAIFGSSPTDPSGAVAASTSGAGGTASLTVAEMSGFPPGIGVLVPTSAGNFVRQVISRAGSSGAGALTLDRTVTGTLTTGNVVRLNRNVWDPSIHEHTHVYLRAEWENFRRDFKGCMSLGQIDFSVGQFAKLMTSWMFTDAADIAEANPTFSEQTTGGPLVNVNNTFSIGNSTFYATDLKVDLGGQMVARRANSGPQGVQGYIIEKGAGTKKPTITCKLQRGVNSNEVADSTGTPSVNSLQAYGLNLGDALADLDVSFQVGTVAGSLGYVRASTAHCVKCTDVVVDGFQQLDVTFECDTPSSATFYPLEMLLG